MVFCAQHGISDIQHERTVKTFCPMCHKIFEPERGLVARGSSKIHATQRFCQFSSFLYYAMTFLHPDHQQQMLTAPTLAEVSLLSSWSSTQSWFLDHRPERSFPASSVTGCTNRVAHRPNTSNTCLRIKTNPPPPPRVNVNVPDLTRIRYVMSSVSMIRSIVTRTTWHRIRCEAWCLSQHRVSYTVGTVCMFYAWWIWMDNE